MEEGLISEKFLNLEETETPSLVLKYGVKKRFLKRYLKTGDDTTSGSQSIIETNNDTNPPDSALLTPEQDAEPASDSGTVPTLSFSPVSNSILPSTNEPCLPLHRAYPAIEYEVIFILSLMRFEVLG